MSIMVVKRKVKASEASTAKPEDVEVPESTHSDPGVLHDTQTLAVYANVAYAQSLDDESMIQLLDKPGKTTEANLAKIGKLPIFNLPVSGCFFLVPDDKTKAELLFVRLAEDKTQAVQTARVYAELTKVLMGSSDESWHSEATFARRLDAAWYGVLATTDRPMMRLGCYEQGFLSRMTMRHIAYSAQSFDLEKAVTSSACENPSVSCVIDMIAQRASDALTVIQTAVHAMAKEKKLSPYETTVIYQTMTWPILYSRLAACDHVQINQMMTAIANIRIV